ncbi:hypothetical protein NKG94_16915 [Micromonospora sp. M12]
MAATVAPYHALGEPFASASDDGVTKRLLFSSWNATPTAVAGLLSYEAERRLGAAGEGHRHLDYRLEHGRPAAMSVLALFWPHPALAELCDPLTLARRRPDDIASLDAFEQDVHELLYSHTFAAASSDAAGPAEPWELIFHGPAPIPAMRTPLRPSVRPRTKGRLRV